MPRSRPPRAFTGTRCSRQRSARIIFRSRVTRAMASAATGMSNSKRWHGRTSIRRSPVAFPAGYRLDAGSCWWHRRSVTRARLPLDLTMPPSPDWRTGAPPMRRRSCSSSIPMNAALARCEAATCTCVGPARISTRSCRTPRRSSPTTRRSTWTTFCSTSPSCFWFPTWRSTFAAIGSSSSTTQQ